MDTKRDANEKKTLPYVSHATFFNALGSIVESGLPPQIDRSVLTQFSGVNQGLVMSAFRYIGLINDKDEPTAKFQEYEQADPEKRKGVLGLMIKDSYPNQVKLLSNGTYQLLKDSFDTVDVPASVKGKCLSFFIGAARATGYTISPHIVKGMNARAVRRDGNSKKRSKANESGNGDIFQDDDEAELAEGMVRVPISVGVGKTWSVIVTEDYDKDDVERFTQIIKITLGDGKKK